jgi:hypothetical protein
MKHQLKQKANRVSGTEVVGTLATLLILGAVLLFGMPFITLNAFGQNQTVSSKSVLNVTNSRPVVTEVYVFDNQSSDNIIDLVGGSETVVYCNATVNDYNGAADVNNATATLYHSTSTYTSPDTYPFHYTNGSCGSCFAIDADNATCSCSFNLRYYASNNTWNCNITVYDNGGDSGSIILHNHGNSTGIVNSLISIDVPSLIDFGNLTVGSTSEEVVHNVTNFGNVPLNITVRAYGGTNESAYGAYAMICRRGNIGLAWEKYSAHVGADYSASMTSVSNTNTQIANFIVGFRSDPDNYGNSTNSTFWKLQVPNGVTGYCNGTVIFTGIAST